MAPSNYGRCFVTGGAGFIGSNLVDRLLEDEHEVVVYDNLSSGSYRFLEKACRRPTFRLVEGDILDAEMLTRSMAGCDIVFHLSANADVRFGLEAPSRDLEQNTLGTFNVLEAMRANDVRRIAFTSTGSVYGEASVIPTPEDAPFPVQTSLYAASKLACEGLIEAYSEGFGLQGWIFRLVSVLGERYSHGHVYDFCKQLRERHGRLDVLGDGNQRKSYVYVQDCIEAILTGVGQSKARLSIFNVGTEEAVTVKDSVAIISAELGLGPDVQYGGGRQGWVGDNPHILLDTARLQALGWKPALSISEGIGRTVRWLVSNPWVFEARA
jgi:UDP-glucose 4-epimerase